MNYEEMLAAKNDGRLNKTLLPIGEYYRVQIDGKYRAVVDIRPEMNSSIAFSRALKKECERNKTLVNRYQLHYTPVIDENGEIQQLEVESGVFLSMGYHNLSAWSGHQACVLFAKERIGAQRRSFCYAALSWFFLSGYG